MSYHIVNIDAPRCTITCRDGQLTCTTDQGQRRLPLEDVAAIIITSFSATLHSHLFVQAAKHGVALILCEAFKPVSLVLPANRSTDTLLSRAQIGLPERVRQELWRKTLDAKCRNQWLLAGHIAPADPRLPDLQANALGRKPHKEAVCSRTFWRIFGAALRCATFRRHPAAGPGPVAAAGRAAGSTPGRPIQTELLLTDDQAGGRLNALLNYGYAVLLSTVLQRLFALGLDPTVGISHLPRERSTPLAYDLMEPFRPCVDWRVFQWVQQHPRRTDWTVSTEYRKWVTGFPLERVGYVDFTLEIQGVIEGVVRSFRRAVLEATPRYYRPWTPKSTKWAGCS